MTLDAEFVDASRRNRVEIRDEIDNSLVNLLTIREEYIVNNRTIQTAKKFFFFIEIRD